MWRYWSYRRTRSCKRAGTRSWRSESRLMACRCRVSHTRRCNSTGAGQRPRTRSCRPRYRRRRRSWPGAPKGRSRWGRPRSLCLYSSDQCHLGVEPAKGGCSRRPSWHRKSPSRQSRRAWTRPRRQVAWRHYLNIRSSRSRNHLWRRRTSRWSPGSRWYGPRSDPPTKSARWCSWTPPFGERTPSWTVLVRRRWTECQAISCSRTCLLWWRSLKLLL